MAYEEQLEGSAVVVVENDLRRLVIAHRFERREADGKQMRLARRDEADRGHDGEGGEVTRGGEQHWGVVFVADGDGLEGLVAHVHLGKGGWT